MIKLGSRFQVSYYANYFASYQAVIGQVGFYSEHTTHCYRQIQRAFRKNKIAVKIVINAHNFIHQQCGSRVSINKFIQLHY